MYFGTSFTRRGARWRRTHAKEHLHETPWVVTVPLILLAIPSVTDRLRSTIEPMSCSAAIFRRRDTASSLPRSDMAAGGRDSAEIRWDGMPWAFAGHGLRPRRFGCCWPSAGGGLVPVLSSDRSWPAIQGEAGVCRARLRILDNKYGFDDFNENSRLPWPAAGMADVLGSGNTVIRRSDRRVGRERRATTWSAGLPRRRAPYLQTGVPVPLRLCHDSRPDSGSAVGLPGAALR